jgi:hypothetical protein
MKESRHISAKTGNQEFGVFANCDIPKDRDLLVEEVPLRAASKMGFLSRGDSGLCARPLLLEEILLRPVPEQPFQAVS